MPGAASAISRTARTKNRLTAATLLLDPASCGRIEQVRVRRLRNEEYPLAGPDAGTAVQHDGEGALADARQHLGLGAHRLDHCDLGGNALGRQREMLGPDAVRDPLPFLRLCDAGPAAAQRFHGISLESALENV